MAADTSRINWFPGHMATARKEIKKVMGKVHLVIEVLDARIPFSSENPLVSELRRDRPVVQILNKSDLADPYITEQWLAVINSRSGVKAIAHQQHQPKLAQRLLSVVREMVPSKAPKRTVAMIMGIPNVGKSTLVNALSGRTIAKTGNKPAVTQHQQRIQVGKDLALLDTPGFLWHKLTPRECGYRLAVTGAISDRVVDAEDIAYFAARFLMDRHSDRLGSHYGLDEVPDREDLLLEAIGRRRGLLRKGGVVDVERAAKILLTDLRAGRLGPLSFESPGD